MALLDLQVERAWRKEKRNFRLIVRLTERTIDRRGQHLLLPADTLEGWRTSLTEPPSRSSPAKNGTVPTRSSTPRSRPTWTWNRPSGQFDYNDLILHLGLFADNCLRLIGQIGLTRDLAPVRHPAKRRRLKTVPQEIMYRAAQFIRKARQGVLDFGRACPVVVVFALTQEELLAGGNRHEAWNGEWKRSATAFCGVLG